MACLNDGNVKLIAHIMCIIYATVIFRKNTFFQAEWFQFCPGERCSRYDGTLHLGHNTQMENWKME